MTDRHADPVVAAEAKRRARAAWGDSPAGTVFAGGEEPGTREFFERVLARRSTYELPWLGEVVPFVSFRRQRVLEIGCGAGYDALTILRSGAEYVGLDIASENPQRTRRHLSFFGLRPLVLQADAERLPIASDSFDIVFSNGVLHHTPDLGAALSEIARVLRHGGRGWLIVYHRDSIFYRLSLGLVEHVVRRGYRRETLAQRLSRIEYNTAGERPLVRVYSRREIRYLCQAAGLMVSALRVRKLTPEDLPNLRGFRWLKRHLPRHWLDRLGRLFGWYLIVEIERVAGKDRG